MSSSNRRTFTTISKTRHENESRRDKGETHLRAPANAACKRRIAISDTGRKGGKKKQGTKTKKRKVERGTGRKKRENIFPFRRGGQTKRRAPNRDVSRNPRAETRTKNPRSRYVTPPPPSSSPPPSPLSEYRSHPSRRHYYRSSRLGIRYRRTITSTVVVVVVSDDETPRSVVVVTRCIIQRARKVGKCIGWSVGMDVARE